MSWSKKIKETEIALQVLGVYRRINSISKPVTTAIGNGVSGVTNFLGLTDTPSAYTGEAGKIVKVNATEDGLEFGTGGGSVDWGDIGGTLANQIDLQSALDEKAGTDDLHNPVTLQTALNDNLLSLSEQELQLDTQSANLILSGPVSGADAVPTFRVLVADDIPDLDTSKITTGTFVDARITESNVTQHQGAIDHGSIAGLGDDDHLQYALLAGRSGGQVLHGGTANGNNLILRATTTGSGSVISTSPFDVSGSGLTVLVRASAYSTISTTGTSFIQRRARGTEASPGNVNDGDRVGAYLWQAFRNGAWRDIAQMRVDVDGTPGSFVAPGRIDFLTQQAQTAQLLEERLSIRNNGQITVFGATPPTGGKALTFADSVSDPSNIADDTAGIYNKAGQMYTFQENGDIFQVAPQDLRTTATPEFTGLGVGVAASGTRRVLAKGATADNTAFLFEGLDSNDVQRFAVRNDGRTFYNSGVNLTVTFESQGANPRVNFAGGSFQLAWTDNPGSGDTGSYASLRGFRDSQSPLRGHYRMLTRNTDGFQERIRVDRHIGIGTSSFPTGGGAPVMVFANAVDDPTGVTAGTAGVYNKAGAMWAFQGNGDVFQVAPQDLRTTATPEFAGLHVTATGFLTILHGDRIQIRNNLSSGGWSRALFEFTDTNNDAYFGMFARGTAQGYLSTLLGRDRQDWTIRIESPTSAKATTFANAIQIRQLGTADTGTIVPDAMVDIRGWADMTIPLLLCRILGGGDLFRVEKTGNVGIGTATPNASAILDVTSTTKAFMPPRMTNTQRDNISSPTAGMVIYSTTDNVLQFYNGTSWGSV